MVTLTLYRADVRNISTILPSNSVHLVVTSPPYWTIKDYKNPLQIGYNQTFNEYNADLTTVWRGCFDALQPNCHLCINIGDQYVQGTETTPYHIIPISSFIIQACLSIGFSYHGDIIWQKKSTKHTSGGGSFMGSYLHPRNGCIEYDYEHILLFKKPGKTKKFQPSDASKAYIDTNHITIDDWRKQVKERSKIDLEHWKEWLVGHWKIQGVQQTEHIAMFPEELPSRLIQIFSFQAAIDLGFDGDTVLDPFLGSGTTMKMAKKYNRNCIGFECNNDFIPNIRKKVGVPDLVNEWHEINMLKD